MRICLINSSYDGVDSPFEKYDPLPDPNRYIAKSRHEFVTRWVTKKNAHAEIDEICREKFDMFMNYMWGIESDDVAGVEATRYLETKGVPILTNPSRFLVKNKVDLQKAAGETGLRMPSNTPGKYPKIVKYSDGYGSLKLDYDSICYTEEAVQTRIEHLLEGNTSGFGVLVQDYIIGKECSAIVVEMGPQVVALTPLKYVFPSDTPPEQEFLTWHNKFEACEDGTIQYALVTDEPARSRLQRAAEDAFKAIGVTNGGAWARVDMRLEDSTGDVYVIEVNCIPVVFYPVGNALGDDLVVSETFPGAQAAFFDMLLATKQMQMGQHLPRTQHMAAIYDKFSTAYNDTYLKSGLRKIQLELTAKFDYSGTVLDVACGNGGFGQALHEQGVNAEITGIDIAQGMLDSPWIKDYYRQPICIGPMQELIMGAGEFDHIVVFGALHFLTEVEFNAVLARIFMLARRSVSFEVDILSDAYIREAVKKHGELCFNANHRKTVEDFGVPKGWRLAHMEVKHIYTSPTVVGDVEGQVMRFEKLEVKTNGVTKMNGIVGRQS